MSDARNDRVVVIGSNSFSGADFIDLLLESATTRSTASPARPRRAPSFCPTCGTGRAPRSPSTVST